MPMQRQKMFPRLETLPVMQWLSQICLCDRQLPAKSSAKLPAKHLWSLYGRCRSGLPWQREHPHSLVKSPLLRLWALRQQPARSLHPLRR